MEDKSCEIMANDSPDEKCETLHHENSGGGGGDTRNRINKLRTNGKAAAIDISDDEFEKHIEASMDGLDGYIELDKIDDDGDLMYELSSDADHHRMVRSSSTCSTDDASNSDDDEFVDAEGEEGVVSTMNRFSPFRSPEALNPKVVVRPLMLPFQVRRRLSQCKEEDEDDDNRTDKQLSALVSKLSQNVASDLDSIKEVRVKKKFIVTKAEMTDALPRPEAVNLRNMTAKQNSATIHFPCRSVNQRASINGIFAPLGPLSRHLDKRFFDTSLVEIKPISTSTKSLDNTESEVDDNVWVKRDDDFKENHYVRTIFNFRSPFFSSLGCV